MTDNELLLAISHIMDKKIAPLERRMDTVEQGVKELKLTNENELIPRLRTIEECYLSTYERYKKGVDRQEQLEVDVGLLKGTVKEHSIRLQVINA